MPLSNLFLNFHWIDFLDIALLSVVIYWVLNLIRGTRATAILMGITVISIGYGFSLWFELDAAVWLIDQFFASAVLILVVLFQADIRTALARVGAPSWYHSALTKENDLILSIAESCHDLVVRGNGGIIVLEQEMGLRDIIETGFVLGATPSSELFQSIFNTHSPLHDGAVIINRRGKIAAARCILPLSTSTTNMDTFGTRHRAALGLSEERDSIVIAISEERREMSLAHQGKITPVKTASQLYQQITQLIQGEDRAPATQMETALPNTEIKVSAE